MDKNKYYIFMGAFVMLTLAVAIMFFAWLLGSGRNHVYEKYAIYFNGTVNGLGIGSAVRYLGVNVGNVDSIMLDDKNPNRVLVIANVDNRTPIRRNTVAGLKFQGITGVAYVDLNGTTMDSPEITKAEDERYPVIHAQQTGIEKALDDIPRVIERLSELAERANRLLNDENLAAISNTIKNVNTMSNAVAESDDGVAKLVKALGSMGQTIQNISSSLNQQSGGGGLDEIGYFIRESRGVVQELKTLVQNLKENPSQLIYKPADRGYDVSE